MSEFKLGRGVIRFECEDGHVFEGECTMMSMEIHQEILAVSEFGPEQYIREGMGLPTAIEGTFTMEEMTITVPQEPLLTVPKEMEELVRVIRFREDDGPD